MNGPGGDITGTEPALSKAETALVGTIYNPPRSTSPWRFESVLPPGQHRLYSVARWALVDALKAVGVRPGDVVFVPELICREVLASLHVAGAVPAFYPVSRDLSAGSIAGEMRQTGAILAVNYFGFPQTLEPFTAYCTRSGAALIEDNALGLFSRDEAGHVLGARGDAAIFSFRKTVPVPDGAAVVVKRGSLPEGSTTPSPVPGYYKAKEAFRPVTGALGPVVTARALDMFRGARRVMTGHAIVPATADAEVRIPMPPDPSALVFEDLMIAGPVSEPARRRALYELAEKVVTASGGVPVFHSLPANAVPFGFPFYVPPVESRKIVGTLARLGLPLIQWPDLPAAVAPSAPEHYRELHVVPFLW